MNSALKWTLAILALLAAAFGVYWFTSKTADTTTTTDPGNPTPGSGSGSSAKPANTMPLKKGSTGDLVKDVQRGINQYFSGNITIDGIFGSQTESALRSRGLPTVLYWREYSYISHKPISVNGTMMTITAL